MQTARLDESEVIQSFKALFNTTQVCSSSFPFLTVHLSQVRAVDLDGPPNNFFIYSIVSGDPKQQFSIDPRTGHITVRSTLDREEVGFTFTPESLPGAHTHLFYQGFNCIC